VFEFKSGIYAHADVKAALRAAQRDKCAFCESVVTHVGFGDVEHYRPKAGFRQREADALTRPGYFWLAYSWDNLFFSCQLCNQRFKKNLFPIAAPTRRARSHNDDLAAERPLLLDPAVDALDRHITYVGETAAPVRGSSRGKGTIAVVGLNRAELIEQRLKRRADLLAMKLARDLLVQRAAYLPPAEVRAALAALNQQLADAILDTAEYAAMARTFTP